MISSSPATRPPRGIDARRRRDVVSFLRRVCCLPLPFTGLDVFSPSFLAHSHPHTLLNRFYALLPSLQRYHQPPSFKSGPAPPRTTDIMTGYPALERSPSRMGFARPPLRLPTDAGEDDDEKWEFAGALLVPSSSTSSEDSNSSDDACEPTTPLDATPIDPKPSLPARTVSLINIPMQLPVVSPPALHYDEVASVAGETPDILATPADHGLSRSALSHLKGFWSVRQDEYAKLEAQLALSEANAYGGIWEAPRDGLRAALFSRLSRPTLCTLYETDTPRPSRTNLNAPIYPRTGDLSTLHDSRSAMVDRVFCHLPLNSINKILFLHDMLDRSNPSSPTSSETSLPMSEAPKDGYSDEDGGSFVDISLRSESSRDTTLVEDDPMSSTEGSDEKHASDTSSIAEYDRTWEVDWLARWQVLLAQVKDDPILPCTPSPSPVDERAFWAALNPPKPAKFYIPAEDDEFFGLDSDGEDEDDYGVLVSQPAYGVTAESLSHEFLHNFRELRMGVGI